MATDSERSNISETLPASDTKLSYTLISGIIGLTNNLVVTQNYVNPFVNPTNLVFPIGISNSSTAGVSGITDFTAYNPYIHYPAGNVDGMANIDDALADAGIDNVDYGGGGGGGTRINVMNSLILATQRFAIYSRQYRGAANNIENER